MQSIQPLSRVADPEQLIDGLGGERLDGSGFENEAAEVAFVEAEE